MAEFICSYCFEQHGLEGAKKYPEGFGGITIYDCEEACEDRHIRATHPPSSAKAIEIIRFYRATGEYGYLSNLYRRGIVFEGRYFDCSEKAYQYGKPKDKEVAEWLISAPKPHLCALAAHALFVFDIVGNWNDIKVNRMRDVLREKFRQHQDLRDKLIATGDAVLIEESKSDAFWGVGKKGNGQNILGHLLMEIRAELRNRAMEKAILENMETWR